MRLSSLLSNGNACCSLSDHNLYFVELPFWLAFDWIAFVLSSSLLSSELLSELDESPVVIVGSTAFTVSTEAFVETSALCLCWAASSRSRFNFSKKFSRATVTCKKRPRNCCDRNSCRHCFSAKSSITIVMKANVFWTSFESGAFFCFISTLSTAPANRFGFKLV